MLYSTQCTEVYDYEWRVEYEAYRLPGQMALTPSRRAKIQHKFESSLKHNRMCHIILTFFQCVKLAQILTRFRLTVYLEVLLSQ